MVKKKVLKKIIVKPIKKSGVYDVGKDLSIVDYRQETAGQVMLFNSQTDYENYRDRNGLNDTDFQGIDITEKSDNVLRVNHYLTISNINLWTLVSNIKYKISREDAPTHYYYFSEFIYKYDIPEPIDDNRNQSIIINECSIEIQNLDNVVEKQYSTNYWIEESSYNQKSIFVYIKVFNSNFIEEQHISNIKIIAKIVEPITIKSIS